MYYYEHSWAKERMAEAIRDHEQDRLGRELRLATRVSRRGMVIRVTTFVMTLFRG
ncbi:MAG: hypothetical protein H0U04_20750 [Rubrobacter sp.]|nr:hypothetical protein [Rubrobacter sp.]